MAKQGVSISEVISYLRHQRVTIIDSIKVVREVYGMPLRQAKSIVSEHASWRDVAEAGDALHEELEAAIQKEINEKSTK
jgi:ribosomal protein L7/L12